MKFLKFQSSICVNYEPYQAKFENLVIEVDSINYFLFEGFFCLLRKKECYLPLNAGIFL
jgi:hypothetical protein